MTNGHGFLIIAFIIFLSFALIEQCVFLLSFFKALDIRVGHNQGTENHSLEPRPVLYDFFKDRKYTVILEIFDHNQPGLEIKFRVG